MKKNMPSSVKEILKTYSISASTKLASKIQNSITENETEKHYLTLKIKEYLPKEYDHLIKIELFSYQTITLFSPPGKHVSQLKFMQESLLEKIQENHPELGIKDIQIKVEA